MSYNRPLNSGPCHVYALIDPRTAEVFYIGVSWNPARRLHDHRSDPGSSAFYRVNDIIRAGDEVIVAVLETHQDRVTAERREQHYICLLPGLSNRLVRPPEMA